MSSMNKSTIILVALLMIALLSIFSVSMSEGKKYETDRLQVGIKFRPETCDRKVQDGDKVSVHYTGKLGSNGEEFDSSIPRGEPFQFTIGKGQVIQGWDLGMLGACVGEKRKLVIPSELGYGARGAGASIPPNSVLVFDVEVMDISE